MGEQERRDCGDPAVGRMTGGEQEITEKEMRADRASEWGTRGEEERKNGLRAEPQGVEAWGEQERKNSMHGPRVESPGRARKTELQAGPQCGEPGESKKERQSCRQGPRETEPQAGPQSGEPGEGKKERQSRRQASGWRAQAERERKMGWVAWCQGSQPR